MEKETSPQEQIPIPSGVSALYFNGFAMGIGGIDLSAILMLNQNPQVELKMTYPTAKGLSAALADAVTKYEELSGQAVVSGIELSKLTANGQMAPAKK